MEFIKSYGISREFLVDNLHIYEHSPSFRTIRVDGRLYRLYFPYIIYTINIHGLKVGLTTRPLESNGDILLPPLPNIDRNYLVCCNPGINSFWGTEFTSHRGWPGQYLLGTLGGLLNWESFSPNSCMEIFNNWPREIEYDCARLKTVTRHKLSDYLKI